MWIYRVIPCFFWVTLHTVTLEQTTYHTFRNSENMTDRQAGRQAGRQADGGGGGVFQSGDRGQQRATHEHEKRQGNRKGGGGS